MDVRPSAQYNIEHFKNSKNIPYENLVKLDKNSLEKELPDPKNVFVSCKTGVTSKKATLFLR